MLKNSQILITGANGFVGTHVCVALQKTDAKLVQLVRCKTPFVNNESSQLEVDLKNRDLVFDIISALQPDYVVHLASQKNRSDIGSQFRNSYDENLSISLNVIEACLTLPKLKRFIFLGSCDEYGKESMPFVETQREAPLNTYGLSKLAVTKILLGLFQSKKFPSVVLRPSVIYGPNQGSEMFLSALIQALLVGKNFEMTHGDQYRDFVYISDVADAIIKALAADSNVNGSVINIGSGASSQVKNIANLVAKLTHSDANSLLNIGAVPYRSTEVMDYAVNIDLAEELLGWTPNTNIEQGLVETIKYFRHKFEGPGGIHHP